MKPIALLFVVMLVLGLGIPLASSVGREAQREILTSPPENPGDSRLVRTYNFSHRVNRMHGGEEYIYYTDSVHHYPGKTYKVNRETSDEELFFDYGGDMIYVEGDYVYIGNSHGLHTYIWKIDKSTREVVWSWEGYGSENVYDNEDEEGDGDSCYGYGVGKYGVYGRGSSRGNSYIRKEDGSVKWTSYGITRYPDYVLPDLKDEVVVETGLWSTNTIQRVSKADGSVIWRRRGPTEDMGEVTHPVDITDDAIWIQVYRGTYPNQYPYALAKWDRETGETLATYPELPYQKIWHLGPEGSLIFDYPDERGKALAWDPEHGTLNKVDSSTWEVYWTTDLGYLAGYAPERPYIDGPFIYLSDPEDPTVIYQYRWREVADTTPPVSSVVSFEGDDYWKTETSFTVTAMANDDVEVASVELWYRYSLDNWTDDVAWKKHDWELYPVEGTNGADGWSWSFDAPYGYGHYEFFSIAIDRAGNQENENIKITKPAETGCRVYQDFMRVAVILAEPHDQNWSRQIENTQENLKILKMNLYQYYTEVSYGVLALEIHVFDNNGRMFKLPSNMDYYRSGTGPDFPTQREYCEEAIEAADAKINYDKYRMVIVTWLREKFESSATYWGLAFPMDKITSSTPDGLQDMARSYIILRLALHAPSSLEGPPGDLKTAAHEIGHQLGREIRGDRQQLPDLYPVEGSWGGVDGWDLMGLGSAHLSSWSKEFIGWLDYLRIDLTSYGEGYYDRHPQWALPNMSYGDYVYFYKIYRADAWWFGCGEETWYILEARTNDARYSRWDIGVPGTGFVLYQVDYSWDLWGLRQWTRVNIVENIGQPSPQSTFLEEGESYHSSLGKGVKFVTGPYRYYPDSFVGDISVSYPSPPGSTTAMLSPIPYELTEGLIIGGTELVLPDLDLHAYTPEGKHVGMNYATGIYELGIEGASASGDLLEGTEWISVPDNVEVFFIASSHDTAEFLKSPAGDRLENENGLYMIRVAYTDEQENWYSSPVVAQIIEPGVESFHPFCLAQNPDGTYSLDVRQGMDLLSPEAWHATIENVLDNMFINQPANRKNALKNKFEAVFYMIKENNYPGAVQKLVHDILEKLDTDGQADWVREPALANELRSFIGLLKYKMRET